MTDTPPRISSTPTYSDAAGFSPTRWTVVLAAAHGTADSGSRRALEELAGTYWFPLYAFIRRQGHDSATAEDLTQEFFARLIEKNSLTAADRARGRFRAFLLTAVKHFLANERDKTQAIKRGGGARVIALDSLDAEARYAIEPAHQLTPERVFEQRWARAVLDHVLAQLRASYIHRNQGAIFDVLKDSLVSQTDAAGKVEMGRRLNVTSGAVSVAIHRLRRAYRQALRDEIAQTVAAPELIDEEIGYLLKCV
jgi:RNA polymerase sigma-70 factor (ECF subfamily)